MNSASRIGVKITQDKDGNVIKEVIHTIPAEEYIELLPLTTKSGISDMTKEILRKIKEN